MSLTVNSTPLMVNVPDVTSVVIPLFSSVAVSSMGLPRTLLLWATVALAIWRTSTV